MGDSLRYQGIQTEQGVLLLPVKQTLALVAQGCILLRHQWCIFCRKHSACLKTKLFQLRCLPCILNALISGYRHEGRVVVILGFVLEHSKENTQFLLTQKKRKRILSSPS